MLRQRQQQRLQALADADPNEVFGLQCDATVEEIEGRLEVVFACEIVNFTSSTLYVRSPIPNFYQTIGSSNDGPINPVSASVGDEPLAWAVDSRSEYPNGIDFRSTSWQVDDIRLSPKSSAWVVAVLPSKWAPRGDEAKYAHDIEIEGVVGIGKSSIRTPRGNNLGLKSNPVSFKCPDRFLINVHPFEPLSALGGDANQGEFESDVWLDSPPP
jgi:hypothetical protein